MNYYMPFSTNLPSSSYRQTWTNPQNLDGNVLVLTDAKLCVSALPAPQCTGDGMADVALTAPVSLAEICAITSAEVNLRSNEMTVAHQVNGRSREFRFRFSNMADADAAVKCAARSLGVRL